MLAKFRRKERGKLTRQELADLDSVMQMMRDKMAEQGAVRLSPPVRLTDASLRCLLRLLFGLGVRGSVCMQFVRSGSAFRFELTSG